jgi:hypothetical protein
MSSANADGRIAKIAKIAKIGGSIAATRGSIRGRVADPSGEWPLNSGAERSEALAAMGVGPHGFAGVGPREQQKMLTVGSNNPAVREISRQNASSNGLLVAT